MSTVQPVGRPGVPASLGAAPSPVKTQEHLRLIAHAVNRINQGQLNSTLYVTLDPDVAQTEVVDSRISPQTAFIFHPQTAHAAAAISTTYAICTNGSATINHANNAQTDRTFSLGMLG